MEKEYIFRKFEIPSLNNIIAKLKPKKIDNKAIDEIKIRGYVQFENGGKKTRWFRNHFVGNGLIGIVNLFAISQASSSSDYPAGGWTTSPFNNGTMVLGTDTTTATTVNMTSLVAPIGTGIGTKPNSQSGSAYNGTSYTYVLYIGTWNAGTVSGTVGEVGLYLKVNTTLQTFGSTGMTTSQNFVSRLSVADGDFTAQTINTSNPFTVNWMLKFAFE